MTFDEKTTRIRQEIDQITDGVGKPIDRGIREPVVAFLMNNFPTAMSCEGHLGDGMFFPWVLVETPIPDNFNNASVEEEQAYIAKNFETQQRMKTALNRFYQGRDTSYKLGIWEQGIYSAFRVQPVVEETQVKAEDLKHYQDEMKAFSEYLMDRARDEANQEQ